MKLFALSLLPSIFIPLFKKKKKNFCVYILVGDFLFSAPDIINYRLATRLRRDAQLPHTNFRQKRERKKKTRRKRRDLNLPCII